MHLYRIHLEEGIIDNLKVDQINFRISLYIHLIPSFILIDRNLTSGAFKGLQALAQVSVVFLNVFEIGKFVQVKESH